MILPFAHIKVLFCRKAFPPPPPPSATGTVGPDVPPAEGTHTYPHTQTNLFGDVYGDPVCRQIFSPENNLQLTAENT